MLMQIKYGGFKMEGDMRWAIGEGGGGDGAGGAPGCAGGGGGGGGGGGNLC